jgi:hypothetical protein
MSSMYEVCQGQVCWHVKEGIEYDSPPGLILEADGQNNLEFEWLFLELSASLDYSRPQYLYDYK